jgi:hypothetical protein
MSKRPPMLLGANFEPSYADAPSYKVSASGTFCKDSWQVKETGIHHTPAGEGRISDLDLKDLQVRLWCTLVHDSSIVGHYIMKRRVVRSKLDVSYSR